MSSSPTAPTSTTRSSTSSRFPSEPRVAVIACGAIAQPVAQIVDEQGLPVDVHPLPPLLHNRPELITGEVERLAVDLLMRYSAVAIGYADCGTYGALDTLCARMGLVRLVGLHCYDVYGGADRIAALLAEQPGTYLLTDFLVRSFARTVLVELGLDRYPELRDDYFRHYTRVVWLAQTRDDELETLARKASDAIGLPLTVIDTGLTGLRDQLARLVTVASPDATARSRPPG